MNIEAIKEVVENNNYPDKIKENIILRIIADDRRAVPMILQMLDSEREDKENLIRESNSELSRALITLEDPNLGKKRPIVELSFVTGEIRKHYLKWKNKIKCNFKVKGLP